MTDHGEHFCFGYAGDGHWTCSCGHVVADTGGLVEYEATPTVQFLKDQWEAHRRDAAEQPDETLCAVLLELMLNRPLTFCDEHGWVQVTEADSGPGFTGARIWWWRMSCGCSGQDLSGDDLEAAR